MIYNIAIHSWPAVQKRDSGKIPQQFIQRVGKVNPQPGFEFAEILLHHQSWTHFVAQFLREALLSAGFLKRSNTQHPYILYYLYLLEPIPKMYSSDEIAADMDIKIPEEVQLSELPCLSGCASYECSGCCEHTWDGEITYHVSLHIAPHKIERQMVHKCTK